MKSLLCLLLGCLAASAVDIVVPWRIAALLPGTEALTNSMQTWIEWTTNCPPTTNWHRVLLSLQYKTSGTNWTTNVITLTNMPRAAFIRSAYGFTK